MTIPTAIVAGVQRAPENAARVRREFLGLIERGWTMICAGDAKDDPSRLLRSGHTPKHKLTLFDTTFYLTHPRQNSDLRFFVAYVVPSKPSRRPKIFPRIFYKDNSLIWRVASHLFLEGEELWVGKGDTKIVLSKHWEHEESAESTTDLPFEIQNALESLNRTGKVRPGLAVLPLVVKRAPRDRIAAYDDFVQPRRAAAKDSGNRIHGGRPVVRFQRRGDPTSQRVAPGFEPDFENGLLDIMQHRSKFYGGMIQRFRVLSTNRKIQHFFFLAPHHAWMIPPQALTTQLSSYGVRTIDVAVDDDAYIPGYEYHFFEADENGQPQLHSQIPDGYAGAPNPLDDTRVDASKWLDKIPMLQELRRFAKTRRAK